MKKGDVDPSADEAQLRVEKLIEALRLTLRPHGIRVFAEGTPES